MIKNCERNSLIPLSPTKDPLKGNENTYEVIFIYYRHRIKTCNVINLLQVIDEYDEQSEVAERLRIKVTSLLRYFQSNLFKVEWICRN